MQIARQHHLRRVKQLLREFPVVALLGARQVGKSTLARQLVAARRAPTTWFDLENPADLARLADPGLELRPLRGLVVQQIIHLLAAHPEQCFHWSTHSGAQLDLLVVAGNRRYGFEIKRTEAPRRTPSMRSAVETLGLECLDVVHAGPHRYALAPHIRALPAAELVRELRPLRG